jgi:hypothetical protein
MIMITFETGEERMVWAMAAQGSLMRNGDTEIAAIVADRVVLAFREREPKREEKYPQQQQQRQ